MAEREPLEHFEQWLQSPLLSPALIYGSLFLIALIESLLVVGLLLPGGMMMIVAGALIAAGHLSFTLTVCATILGAILGDGISFWLGHHYGDKLHQRWPFTRYPQLWQRGHDFFAKHGGKSVFLGRFIGPIRPLIPAVAGVMGMPSAYFLLMNILSAALWAPVYLAPGMILQEGISNTPSLLWLTMTGIGLFYMGWIWLKTRH